MKIKLLLFVKSVIFLSALLYGGRLSAQNYPKITLSMKESALQLVMKSIEAQTNFTFFYDENEINTTQKVSVEVKNSYLPDVLSTVLKGTDIKFEIRNHHIVLLKDTASGRSDESSSKSSSHKVRGRVVDSQGLPVPGVQVLLKWGDVSVITGADGTFAMNVPYANSTLDFSRLGFIPLTLQLEGKTEVEVVMEEGMTTLNEVVVVGYGTQKKLSVTGSVASASMSNVRSTATPSLSNTLAGSMSGIITQQISGEPGNDVSQIFIRGMGTWQNRNPLTLVDGIERDINTINSYEIESITMLKDASATAVYGVRGANGVILITTKRGSEGAPQVTFRTENAVMTALRLPEYIDGYEYAGLVNEALRNVSKPEKYTAADMDKFRDGSDPYFHPSVDWVDEILKKNAFQSINNLSVSGGGRYVNYYVSVGYTKQTGIYRQDPTVPYRTNADVSRYNFRSNVDIKVVKNLTLNLGIGGIIQHNYYPGVTSDRIFYAMKVISPIQYYPINPDSSLSGGPSYLNDNPWGLVAHSGYSRHDKNSLQGTFSARWDLSDLVTKGLSVKGTFSYDHYANINNQHYKEFETKRFLGRDSKGRDSYTVYREEAPMAYSVINDIGRSVYMEAALNYDRTFNNHSVSGLLLFNRNEYVNLGTTNSRYNIPYRRQGLAGRITYSYDNRYLLELNVGYNGSENFPKGKRYGFFPSVSAGWIISGENFWKGSFAVSHLKLRASLGQVGNDQIGGSRFLFENLYSKSVHDALFGMSQTPYQGLSESQIGNSNVSWEVATKANFGMDINLFNNDLQIQIDGFYEYRKGILLKREGSIPELAGINGGVLPYANLGVVKNRGIDGMIEYHKRSGDFYYAVRGTLTYARNVVVENDEATPKWDYQTRIGKRINQPFGLVALGFFKNQDEIDSSPKQSFQTVVHPGDIKYMDINKDKVIDAYDEIAIGHPRIPELVAGLGFTFGYKNLELSMFFTGVSQTSVFIEGPGIYAFNLGLGTYNVFDEYYDNRWTSGNLNAKYPAVSDSENPNNNRRSTVYMRNGSYLRLRTAEIAYNIPRSFLKKIRIDNARVFLNGMNLFTFDGVKIMNPESNDGTGGYPLQRSVNLGLQIGF